MTFLGEDLLRIGKAIEPLLDELPMIPLNSWHRFSFDVVQNSNGIQVVHIRFAAIPSQQQEPKHES